VNEARLEVITSALPGTQRASGSEDANNDSTPNEQREELIVPEQSEGQGDER
jgi:hypothetical protein